MQTHTHLSWDKNPACLHQSTPFKEITSKQKATQGETKSCLRERDVERRKDISLNLYFGILKNQIRPILIYESSLI